MKITKKEKVQKIINILETLYLEGYIYSLRAMQRRFGIDYRRYFNNIKDYVKIKRKSNPIGQARYKIMLKPKYRKYKNFKKLINKIKNEYGVI